MFNFMLYILGAVHVQQQCERLGRVSEAGRAPLSGGAPLCGYVIALISASGYYNSAGLEANKANILTSL